MPSINAAVAWAVATAADNSHGYSMQNRLGNPDYDCSSFVAAALIAGGFAVSPTMATPWEYNSLINVGFVEVPLTDPRVKGDIFINPASGGSGHTCMCVDATNIVEAQGWYQFDPTPGDQSGYEIRVTPYYDSGYVYHMRYPSASPGHVPVWHAKNFLGYSRTSQEAQDNAVMIYNALFPYGWTVNAVAGLLGNIALESGYNPWMWEGGFSQDTRVASTDTSALTDSVHGYGLLQFTSASTYCWDSTAQGLPDFGPNYLDIPGNRNDGTAQCQFVHLTHVGKYLETSAYPETYDQYIASNQSADYLAAAWLYNYQRPLDPSATVAQRQAEALYWERILPSLIIGKTSRRMPIIFYLSRRTRR